MATNQPQGGGFDSFLRNFMGLVQTQNQIKQMRINQKQQIISGFQQFTDLLQETTDPAGQAALVDTYEGMGFDRPALEQIAKGLAPNAGVINRYLAGEGLQTISGTQTDEVTPEMEAAQSFALAKELGTTPSGLTIEGLRDKAAQGTPLSMAEMTALQNVQTFDTMLRSSPGEFAQDAALTGISPEQYRQGWRIGAGIELNAGQMLGNQEHLQRMEHAWASLRTDKQLRELALALQGRGLDIEMDKLAASMATGQNPLPLLEELGTNIRALGELPDEAPLAVREGLRSLINQGVEHLTGMGVFEPEAEMIDPRTGQRLIRPRVFTEEDVKGSGGAMSRFFRGTAELPMRMNPGLFNPGGVFNDRRQEVQQPVGIGSALYPGFMSNRGPVDPRTGQQLLQQGESIIPPFLR